MQRPVVKALFKLIRFRNENAAFNGEFSLEKPNGHQIALAWNNGAASAKLFVDVKTKEFIVSWSDGDQSGEMTAADFLVAD